MLHHGIVKADRQTVNEMNVVEYGARSDRSTKTRLVRDIVAKIDQLLKLLARSSGRHASPFPSTRQLENTESVLKVSINVPAGGAAKPSSPMVSRMACEIVSNCFNVGLPYSDKEDDCRTGNYLRVAPATLLCGQVQKVLHFAYMYHEYKLHEGTAELLTLGSHHVTICAGLSCLDA